MLGRAAATMMTSCNETMQLAIGIFSRRGPVAGMNEMTVFMYGDLSYPTCLYEYS